MSIITQTSSTGSTLIIENARVLILQLKPVAVFALTVIITNLLHWTLIQVYSNYCAPSSIFGFFSSFISLGSPMCQFINYAQYEISKQYVKIWAAAGVAIITWMIASKMKQ